MFLGSIYESTTLLYVGFSNLEHKFFNAYCLLQLEIPSQLSVRTILMICQWLKSKWRFRFFHQLLMKVLSIYRAQLEQESKLYWFLAKVIFIGACYWWEFFTNNFSWGRGEREVVCILRKHPKILLLFFDLKYWNRKLIFQIDYSPRTLYVYFQNPSIWYLFSKLFFNLQA